MLWLFLIPYISFIDLIASDLFFDINTPLPAASPSSLMTKGGLNFSMKPKASFFEFART